MLQIGDLPAYVRLQSIVNHYDLQALGGIILAGQLTQEPQQPGTGTPGGYHHRDGRLVIGPALGHPEQANYKPADACQVDCQAELEYG